MCLFITVRPYDFFFFANTVKYWSTIWHSTHITIASNLKYFRKYTIIWNLFSICKVQRKSKNNSQFLRFWFFKTLYLWLASPDIYHAFFRKTLLFEDTRRRDPICNIILRDLMLVKILEWSKFVQNKIWESFELIMWKVRETVFQYFYVPSWV